MKEKYSRGELAKEVLKGLALGGFIAACFVAPNFAQVSKLFKVNNAKDRWRLKRVLANLTRERLVEISYGHKDGDVIKITEDGRKRVLKYKYDDLKFTIPKKWDKRWRLVLFDIPEPHRKGRVSLTFKLREMGFYPLQKSVFIAPYECRDEVDFICEFFRVREYVNYFVVVNPENEEYLRKWFDL